MPETLVTHGLCEVCVNAVKCVYLRQARSPVLQCGEFDLCQPSATVASDHGPASAGLRRSPNARQGDSGTHTGLCRDCENRRDCTFPRLEGGVWHCEEYR